MNSQEMLSLNKLNDIVIPEAPGWWPPAPGFWLLLALAIIVLLLIGYRFYLFWNRNRYRRAGLLLLEHAATEYEVSVVLKRVALAAYPREQVASLYGDEWLTFLHQTSPQANFPEDFSRDQNRETSPALRGSAAAWIKQHRRPATDREAG